MRRLSALLAACLLAFPLARPARAATTTVPLTLGHQGRLLQQDDTPAKGPVDLTFQLHESPDSSIHSPFWTETQSGVVLGTNGEYAVQLGSVKPLSADTLAHPRIFLSVTVNGTELLPRLPLASTAFAIAAEHANHADAAALADDSSKLGGQTPDYYATAASVTAIQNTLPTLASEADLTTLSQSLSNYAKASDLTALSNSVATTYLKSQDAASTYLKKTGDDTTTGKLTTAGLSTGALSAASANVSGAVSAGSLSTSGGAQLGGATQVAGPLTANSLTTTGSGAATIGGALSVGGATTLAGLTASGAATLNNGLTVNGDALFASNVKVNGTLTATLSGNGAAVTNVNASQLGGIAANYYTKNTDNDFTDPVSSSSVDTSRWTITSGQWTTANQALTSASSSLSNFIISSPTAFPTSRDFVMEADVSWVNGLYGGFIFHDASGNGVLWLIRDYSGSLDTSLMPVVGASTGSSFCYSPHDQISAANFSGSGHFMLIVRGNSADGYVTTGVSVLTTTHLMHCYDPRVGASNGTVGLYSWSGVPATGFDNIRVRTAPPPLTPSEVKGEITESFHLSGSGYINVTFKPCFTSPPRVVCTESQSATNFNICKFDGVTNCGASMAVATALGTPPPTRGWDVIAYGN